jgi:transcriptional regulator with GAF, ATPase, and Fis domain
VSVSQPPGPGTATDVLAPDDDRGVAVGVVVRAASGTPNEHRLGAMCRIGSGPDNDIVIADRTVSRAHAELARVSDGVLVRDLGSRNGTFYLGQRVKEMVLAVGTRIQLGTATVALDPDTETLLSDLQYDRTEHRGIVGASPRMRKLFALLQRLETSLATVLIEGESGVGKERVARAIHDGSRRGTGKLVIVNCGAIPRDLVASELFGHRRGAFTGAVDTRKGAFELAHLGTLFLDEVGELPLEVQPALLRALELGELRPVGDEETKRVEVRVLAATNRDLSSEVAAGRFREDLFYRLAVVRVQVPPLRGRPEDIDLLARHFARELGIAQLPTAVLEELKTRSWRGNARELRNALQAYAAVGQLPPATGGPDGESGPFEIDPTMPYAEQKDVVIDDFTRAYLRALIAYSNGNQAAAARIAQLDRTYLGRLLQKYGINPRR